jgi:hypothetical protein
MAAAASVGYARHGGVRAHERGLTSFPFRARRQPSAKASPTDDAAGCLLFLGPSGHSFLIAAAAFGAEEAGKGVARGARIGMGVEAATAPTFTRSWEQEYLAALRRNPQPAVLRELVLNLHTARRADPRDAEHHQPDQRPVAEAKAS